METNADGMSKWFLSLVAAVVGAALAFAGTFVAARVASIEETAREHSSFLNEHRIETYGVFAGAMYEAQVAEVRFAGVMSNSSDDTEYFRRHVDEVLVAMKALRAAKGQVDIIGSENVKIATEDAVDKYQELFDTIYDAAVVHMADPQVDRFNKSMEWQRIAECVANSSRVSVASYAQLDVGATLKTPQPPEPCSGAIE
jgi:hypothetical protein